ncbi:hypothetical protein ACFQ1M_03750 [Sungkyunkwania multivorans]|uniref:Lipoprotein n=1 Tax=Sungkyunkwania multivorans TaxID=1173618 RepID=A0ABW3CVI8_9FLAO
MVFNIKETYLTLVFLSLLSCSSSKTPIERTEIEKSTTTVDQLAFLTFRAIQNTGNNEVTIKLLAKKFSEGSAKERKGPLSSPSADRFIFSLFDEDNHPTSQYITQNPLLKDVEYLNDNKEFEKRRVLLDSTDLTIRLFAKKGTKFVTVKRVLANSKDTISLYRAAL